MFSSVDYLFHSTSYTRFHTVATVLECFVASAPRAVRVEQLVQYFELPEIDVRTICSNLEKEGLIAGADEPDQWMLVGSPGEITLEDVWASVVAEEHANDIDCCESTDDIGVLIGQALLAINQSISTHLRKFQLDRIKTSQTVAFL